VTRKQAEQKYKPIALAALKRAAKQALELALQTKTPLWVMEGNKIVDATKANRKVRIGKKSN
jgi:hypothetical protein